MIRRKLRDQKAADHEQEVNKMRKNMMDLLKVGVVVPALVLSMAACGNSSSADAGKSAEAPAAEAEATQEAEQEAEAPEEAADTKEAEEAGVETTYENGGFKLTVPAEFANKVIVDTPADNDDGILFEVTEKASVEAAKAKGSDYDGIGWLFAIGTRDEETFRKMLCSDMSGEDPIGYDADGTYYVYFHPTDVRYDRETPEQMQADMDEWTEVVEWANTMKDKFAEENAGITRFNWSGTVLEAYLARTAYDEEAVYNLSTLEFAQDGVLEPNENVDAEKYFKLMTEDATYEVIDDQDIDGEYVVLNFPEDEVRFDFFYGEDKDRKNLIRQVWGDYEQIYKVTFADETKTANDIMDAWARELAENR